GLAQRFLEKDLFTDEDAPGEATVLEVKEVKGLGLTLDAILYKGMVRKGDRIVIGSFGEPVVTNVRAILKPRPLDEIKDPRDEFMATDEVSAAAGIKISASNLEGVISGAPLRVAAGNEDSLKAEVKADMTLDVEVKDEGLIIKADAIGSLEALIFELRNLDIPIRKCEIGSVSKKDVIEAATLRDPLKKCILAFNVSVLPDAKEELAKYKEEVGIFTNNVIYKLIEDHKTWIEEKKIELDKLRRREISYPGSVLFLPNCTFRVSKPAVVGVRVLVGRISAGKGLMRPDGKVIGRIKSIQRENKSVREAIAGNEVAIAIEGITVGRQINEGDLLYVDIPEAHVKLLKDVELNRDEKEILEKVLEIRRKSDVFWGM
ncbi:MAG: translation initiation factor IF-2, partial [Thermoplasmata archaeon]|nr:translation initiation factor IF-2 [Thermoplasmata archaeon]